MNEERSLEWQKLHGDVAASAPMSMMPGSSRDRILELERANAVLKGALEAANEQNERLRDERDRYRDALETCRDAAAALEETI